MIGVIAIAPKAMAKYGPKAMIVAGLVVLAIGMGWLSLVRPDGKFWLDVLPAPLVAALGCHWRSFHPWALRSPARQHRKAA